MRGKNIPPKNVPRPANSLSTPHELITEQIRDLNQRLTEQTGQAALRVLAQVMAELDTTIEELLVAEEEMRVQNEQLANMALALDEERRKYQDLFDAAPDALLVTDTNGLIREANQAACGLLSLTHRYLLGKPLAAFVPLADRPAFRGLLRDLGRPQPHEEHEEDEEREMRLQPRRKPLVTVAVTVAAVPVAAVSRPRETGETGLSLRWVLRDIRHRRLAEAHRLRLMVDALPHIAWTTDAAGTIDFYNQRWDEYSGLTKAQTQAGGWEQVIHPDDWAQVEDRWRQAWEAGAPSELEYRLRRADGEYRWHRARAETVRDGAGQVILGVCTATDITESKAAERAQAARLEQEHTIAAQLQAALQPPLPRQVPGLALTRHYEVAWAEDGVGGDFFDVFALEPGYTALVVGDLSGKGLAAAAQVATVRNMLRAILYSSSSLPGALTTLNEILAGNGLLEGFATLFVGVFEADTCLLKYANCGQEPALVRRAATGAIEALDATGPILGTLVGAEFDAGVVHLGPGDALAIFTDGLTEVGPSRTDMLEIEGVAALLASPLPPDLRRADEIAECLALRLIADVDTYAQGGVRDDVCLLVAVVR